MQNHSPAFMPAQCCRHTVCKSLGPFFLGAQRKEHSGAGVALCPFGQGFSAVIWSIIFSLDVMTPSCLGCIKNNCPSHGWYPSTSLQLRHHGITGLAASQPSEQPGQLLQTKQSRWASRGAGPAQAPWPLGLDCLYPVPFFVISQLYAGKGMLFGSKCPPVSFRKSPHLEGSRVCPRT